MKHKLYFKDIDSTTCYSLNFHLKEAQEEGLDKITLVEAIHDKDTKGYVWCTHEGEVTEKDMCKKSECIYYQSNNAKGVGVCKHRGRLYLHGEERTFIVPPNFKN